MNRRLAVVCLIGAPILGLTIATLQSGDRGRFIVGLLTDPNRRGYVSKWFVTNWTTISVFFGFLLALAGVFWKIVTKRAEERNEK